MMPPRLLTTLLLALGLAACAGSLDVRHYTLAPAAAPAPRGTTPTLAVGPVSIPDYLLRSDLVTRIDANRISHSADRRWAEPLDRGIQRVVAENLGALLDSTRVGPFPAIEARREGYRVALRVHRFEAEDQRAVGVIDWTLRRADSGDILAGSTFVGREAIADMGAAAITAGLSRLLAALADDIAGAVDAAQRQES